MRTFELDDYKSILRTQARELGRSRKGLTLKRIAERVPMQYTYLSRALNRDDTHLTEDQLYSVCHQLEFFADETDYVFALRALSVTRHPGRREFLRRRVETLRRSRQLQAEEVAEAAPVGNADTKFLLSPLAWVTYFSLMIDAYRDNPAKIARALGMSDEKLLEILKDLSEQSLIETEGSPWKVKRVLKNHFHYATSHPLTRLHQQLLKDFANQHLLKIPERDRLGGFTATFNADAATAQAIHAKFREFIQGVEKLVMKAPTLKTYQLVFDLFPWN